MEKIVLLGLVLFPLIINKFIHSKKILIFMALIGLQFIVFFTFKQPNCYEIGCPDIEKNNERMLFYEKFNTQDDDLNTLRSEHFQQNHLYKALHYQLIIFLIFLSLSNDEKYEKTLNSILYIVLTVFSLEASTLLATELYRYQFTLIRIPFNLTYFEAIQLIKMIEISLLLLVREISASFFKSNIDILEQQLLIKEQSEKKKNETKPDQPEGETKEESAINYLRKAIQFLKQKPKKTLLSIENTYNIISLSGIVQLFLS